MKELITSEQFTQTNLVVFQQLSAFKKQKELMEKQEQELKDYLVKAMDEAGIKSIKNDYITISYVAEGKSSVSIDTKKLKEQEPELYDELLRDYPKTNAGAKAYVKFTVK